MKKFFAIFTAVVLMPTSQIMAWQGGPFSNNNPLPGGDDGVYEAVGTMSNGVGLFRFAVRNNGTSSETQAGGGGGGTGATQTVGTSSNVQFNAGLLGAQSSNVWYYKGIAYYGTCFGIANSDLGIVSAIGNASSTAGINTVVVGNPPQVVILPGINTAIVGGSAGGNVGFANSSFIAKMRDKGPSVRFSGRGQISFTGNVDTVVEIEAINPANQTGGVFTPVPINGVNAGNTTQTTHNVTSSTQTSPGGGTTNATFAGTTNQTSLDSYTRLGTGGEDSDFEQRGHVRQFLVFGTKVSSTVSP